MRRPLHSRAERRSLTAEDVGVTQRAMLGREQDPVNDVVDMRHDEPELGERAGAKGAPRRTLQLLADERLVAGAVNS